MNDLTRLEQIERSMRAVGRQERELVAQAHFELFISPQRLDHLTFAAPLLPDPAEWAAPVAAMKQAFVERGKRPRLEYMAQLHPGLAAALEAAGLHCESRAPVMGLAMEAFTAVGTAVGTAVPPPTPFTIQPLHPEDETLLRAYLLRQSVAYGGAEDEAALAWLPNLRSGLREGSVLAATLLDGKRPLAGAAIQIGDGLGELAGVWTDPQQRQRGLAYAVCRRVLADYAAAGYAHCWLSAAAGAQRLYEKLGFVTIGTQLNYGL